jgi:hypothetical protein
VYNNTVAHKPSILLSNQEEECNLRVSNINPEGWKMARVNIPNQITSGTMVWFGVFTHYSFLRFDYGLPCIEYFLEYCEDWETYFDDGDEYETEVEVPLHEWIRREENVPLDQKAYMSHSYLEGDNSYWNVYPGARVDYRLSMYLEENSIAYTRTLTQGIKLTDTRKLAWSYKRTATQAVKGTMNIQNMRGLNRVLVNLTGVISTVIRNGNSKRRIADMFKTETELGRQAGINRYFSELGTAFDQHRPIGGYIRGLLVEAASSDETRHGGEYYRNQMDTANIEAVSLRHLFIFIRLLTTGFVRDFIIRRFLKSNEDIVLKSCVCREITLESSIH